ncbi:hypothetical protein DL96DRAFT_1591138 [Flagelloscypha sp. PMI_526]|nr:hypothetical protein DL96DRAFT_1591138 [Flagelloscypha sp. PMI_526]
MRIAAITSLLAAWLLIATAIPYSHPLALLPRQTIPDVPDKCKNPCDGVNAALALGCQPSQCCTKSFENDYRDCALCLGKAVNATGTDWAAAQSDLDQFVLACEAKGFNLTKVTLPDQNPSRTLSSVPVGQSTVTSLPSSSTSSLITVAPAVPSAIQSTISAVPFTGTLPSVSVAAPAPSSNNGMVVNAQLVVTLCIVGAIGLVL